jgi:hypothetical protein
MERVYFTDHKDKRILVIDFSNATKEEILDSITKAKAIFEQQPKNSVLSLTDTRGARFDSEVSKAINEYVEHNKPYVKAGTVVGITGLQKVLYTSAMVVTGRALRIFDDHESAKEWLVQEN